MFDDTQVRKHRPARYETRVENAIGAKLAQSEDLTSGNPDYVYRAIRNGSKLNEARAERGFDEWKPGLRVQSDTHGRSFANAIDIDRMRHVSNEMLARLNNMQ